MRTLLARRHATLLALCAFFAAALLAGSARADNLTGGKAERATIGVLGELSAKMVASGYVKEARLLKQMLGHAKKDGLGKSANFSHASRGGRNGSIAKFNGAVPAAGSEIKPSTIVQVSRVGDRRSQRYRATVQLSNGQFLDLAMNRHKLQVKAIIPGVIGFGSKPNTMVRRAYEVARKRPRRARPRRVRARSHR